MAQDVKALLASAKRAERSVPVCLRGDLFARVQVLHRRIQDAERDQGESFDGEPAARELAEELEQVRQEMRDNTLEVMVRALPRRKFTALMAEHPPREDNEKDARLGMNEATFFDALVRRSVVDPALDEEDWAKLDDALADGQWQALTAAAWAVNASDVDVPFSQAASQILRSSEPE